MTLSLPLGIDRPAQAGDTGRHALDAYYTPHQLAAALVRRLPFLPGQRVLEPSAGGGAFVDALVGHPERLSVTALDVNPRAPAVRLRADALVDALPGVDFLDHQAPTDWIVGNPPYDAAEAHVRHALSLARVGVAFLLRLAFLASARRVPLWQESPLALVSVLAERPSFAGGGTDSDDYAFFIWRKGWTYPATVEVIG